MKTKIGGILGSALLAVFSAFGADFPHSLEEANANLLKALTDFSQSQREELSSTKVVLRQGEVVWTTRVFTNEPSKYEIEHVKDYANKLLNRESSLDFKQTIAKDISRQLSAAAYAVPVLAQMLDESSPPTERILAIVTLGDLGHVATNALPQLTRLLASSDPLERETALLAMVRIGPANDNDVLPTIEKLVRATRDPEPRIRVIAAIGLAQALPPPKEVTTAFAKLLEDSEVFVRIAACRAIGSVVPSGTEYLPQLVKLSGHSNSDVAAAAIIALGEFKFAAASATSDVTKAFARSEWKVVAAACQTLPAIAGSKPFVLKQLKELLAHRDWHISEAAAYGIGSLGIAAKDLIPELFNMKTPSEKNPDADIFSLPLEPARNVALKWILSDTNFSKIPAGAGEFEKAASRFIGTPHTTNELATRLQLLVTLGEFSASTTKARNAVADSLKDESWLIRFGSGRLLRKWNTPEVELIGAYLRALTSNSEDVRDEALDALHQWKQNPRVRAGLVDLWNDPSISIVRKATDQLRGHDSFAEGISRALNENHKDQAAPFLVSALANKSSEVRLFAVEELGETASANISACALVIPDLIVGLTNPQPGVRIRSARILGDIRDSNSVPAIMEALKKEDFSQILGGPTYYVSPFPPSKEYPVRRALITALGKTRDNRAILTLCDFIQQSDDNLSRASAIEASGELGIADSHLIELLEKTVKEAKINGQTVPQVRWLS